MTEQSYQNKSNSQVKFDTSKAIERIRKNCPQEMQSFKNWVAWKRVPRGDGKTTKPPFQVNGRNAKDNDPTTWGYFNTLTSEIEKYPNKFAGVGFVFSEDTGIIGVDLDHILDPETGKITAQFAHEIVNRLNSYTEVSPSGDGLHIIVKGDIPASGNDGYQGDVPKIEMYKSGQFLTFTGNVYDGKDKIQPRNGELKWCYDFMKSRKVNDKQYEKEHSPGGGAFIWDGDIAHLPIKQSTKLLILNGAERGQRSEAIMTVLNALVFSCLDDGQIFDIFRQYPIGEKFIDDKKSSESWLQNQIDKARSHTTARATAYEKKQHHFNDDPPGESTSESSQTSEDDFEEVDPETWPVLDRDAIHPGFIRDFVLSATADSEADPAAVLGTFITRLAVEVGRTPYMMVGDSKQHCNLLAAIAGPTGAGRKGTSAKPVERVFALGSDLYIPARITPGPLSSGEGLIFAVHDEIKKWEPGKKAEPGRWVIVDPGVDDKRLFILTEEFSSALQAMAREGNTLSSIVRQVFDTGTLDPLTKSSKIKATGAHIGIVGHITIYELNELLRENEIHNGLINRFLWFCSRRQKVLPFPKPMSDKDIIYFQSEIREIVSFANDTTEISLSADGRELWEEYYPGLSESKGGFLGAVLERAAALVLRIAMLMALVDRTNQIGESQLKTAIMLWRYCEASTKYIFSDKAAQNPLTTKILDMLEKKSMSLTDISNELNRNVSSASIRQAIKELMENKRITSKTIKTAGRDKTIYSISK